MGMNWPEIESELTKLAREIDFKPDYIIGIARGGIIPARILVSKLEVKDMQCLTVKKRDGDREVVTDILEDLTGKSVLLVEDMLERGKSLIVAKQYLGLRGAVVRTLAIYIQPYSEIIPDYYLAAKEDVPKFPWE
jgi:hypoxanthine phosphoribosyltransferase